ncbi:DEAD/DEAH box helicase family protein [Streptococcus merionis]|uniref:DEAD/DEAH box helicase family protein n=1 Tax=Streptococcus merionis TaxID=400065 RepID=UPI003518C35E
MAIDFGRQLNNSFKVSSNNPIEIYDSLDRSATVGPLRPVQENILKSWYDEKKDDEELIIKLPTGSGKTLIGLLILKSKLNSGEGPCIYMSQ